MPHVPPGVLLSPRLMGGSFGALVAEVVVGAPPTVSVLPLAIPRVVVDPDEIAAVPVRFGRDLGDLSLPTRAQWRFEGTGSNPILPADFVDGAYPSGEAAFLPGDGVATSQLNFAPAQPSRTTRSGRVVLTSVVAGRLDRALAEAPVYMVFGLDPTDDDLSQWALAWSDPATGILDSWTLWGATGAGAVAGYQGDGSLRLTPGPDPAASTPRLALWARTPLPGDDWRLSFGYSRSDVPGVGVGPGHVDASAGGPRALLAAPVRPDLSLGTSLARWWTQQVRDGDSAAFATGGLLARRSAVLQGGAASAGARHDNVLLYSRAWLDGDWTLDVTVTLLSDPVSAWGARTEGGARILLQLRGLGDDTHPQGRQAYGGKAPAVDLGELRGMTGIEVPIFPATPASASGPWAPSIRILTGDGVGSTVAAASGGAANFAGAKGVDYPFRLTKSGQTLTIAQTVVASQRTATFNDVRIRSLKAGALGFFAAGGCKVEVGQLAYAGSVTGFGCGLPQEGQPWPSTDITYGYPDTGFGAWPAGTPSEDTGTFTPFPTGEARAMIRRILDGFERDSLLRFTEVDPVVAQIRVSCSLNFLGNNEGHAYYPPNGSVWIKRDFADAGYGWGVGSRPARLLAHELAHALNMRHPFDSDNDEPLSGLNVTNTIMMHNVGPGETLFPFDVEALALQYAYDPAAGYVGGGDTIPAMATRLFLQARGVGNFPAVPRTLVGGAASQPTLASLASNLDATRIDIDPLHAVESVVGRLEVREVPLTADPLTPLAPQHFPFTSPDKWEVAIEKVGSLLTTKVRPLGGDYESYSVVVAPRTGREWAFHLEPNRDAYLTNIRLHRFTGDVSPYLPFDPKPSYRAYLDAAAPTPAATVEVVTLTQLQAAVQSIAEGGHIVVPDGVTIDGDVDLVRSAVDPAAHPFVLRAKSPQRGSLGGRLRVLGDGWQVRDLAMPAMTSDDPLRARVEVADADHVRITRLSIPDHLGSRAVVLVSGERECHDIRIDRNTIYGFSTWGVLVDASADKDVVVDWNAIATSKGDKLGSDRGGGICLGLTSQRNPWRLAKEVSYNFVGSINGLGSIVSRSRSTVLYRNTIDKGAGTDPDVLLENGARTLLVANTLLGGARVQARGWAPVFLGNKSQGTGATSAAVILLAGTLDPETDGFEPRVPTDDELQRYSGVTGITARQACVEAFFASNVLEGLISIGNNGTPDAVRKKAARDTYVVDHTGPGVSGKGSPWETGTQYRPLAARPAGITSPAPFQLRGTDCGHTQDDSVLTTPRVGQDRLCANGGELAAALAAANPGDKIILNGAGPFTAATDFVAARGGTSTSWVTITCPAGNPRTRRITRALEVRAPFIEIKEIEFDGVGVRLRASDLRFHHNAIHDTPYGTDPTGFRAVYIANGSRVEVNNNELWSLGGFGVSVMGSLDPGGPGLDADIHHNYIHDSTGAAANGHEAIQAGSTQGDTDLSLRAHIHHNIVERCSVDDEAISIKSSDNLVELNTLLDSDARINNRHGERNTIRSNWIEGSRGIYVRDRGALVYGNKVTGTVAPGVGIAILAGDVTPSAWPAAGQYPAAADVQVYGNDSDGLVVGRVELGASAAPANATRVREHTGTVTIATGTQTNTDSQPGVGRDAGLVWPPAAKLGPADVGYGRVPVVVGPAGAWASGAAMENNDVGMFTDIARWERDMRSGAPVQMVGLFAPRKSALAHISTGPGDESGAQRAVTTKADIYAAAKKAGMFISQVIPMFGGKDTAGPFADRWLAVAGGRYDTEHRAMANALKGYGHDLLWIRLAHECNSMSQFDSMAQDTSPGRRNFIAAWRYLVTLYREYLGDTVKFDWNQVKNKPLFEGYPGDDYVDMIGVDCYGNSPEPPPDGNGKEADYCRAEGDFAKLFHPKMNAFKNFAVSHSKKIGFAEWGVTWTPPFAKVADSKWYIRGMLEYFAANSDIMGYECYFNRDDDAGHVHSIMYQPQNGPVKCINAAAEYIRYWTDYVESAKYGFGDDYTENWTLLPGSATASTISQALDGSVTLTAGSRNPISGAALAFFCKSRPSVQDGTWRFKYTRLDTNTSSDALGMGVSLMTSYLGKGGTVPASPATWTRAVFAPAATEACSDILFAQNGDGVRFLFDEVNEQQPLENDIVRGVLFNRTLTRTALTLDPGYDGSFALARRTEYDIEVVKDGTRWTMTAQATGQPTRGVSFLDTSIGAADGGYFGFRLDRGVSIKLRALTFHPEAAA